MFLFWLVVVLLLVALYVGLVAAGLMDLSLGLPEGHPVRRLARGVAGPFRKAADEDAVEEMARRLRGGPGSWPAVRQ